MSDDSAGILGTLRKIHALLELLAEEKIAERDARQRQVLLEIAGSSVPLQKSIMLMDGSRSQKEIRTETLANQGNLSTLVGKLHAANLLTGDTKTPKLSISIPANFFDKNGRLSI
jgi:hypothetical protein